MTASADHDDLLGAAIEEYLTCRDRGEHPDPIAYLSRYPGLEGELREFFENMGFLDDQLAIAKSIANQEGLGRWFAPAEVNGSDPPRDDPAAHFPQIPGFRIAAELGAGSQGIVYKARQLGMARDVALKVIREGIFASTRERRRFENEVRVVSGLHHAGIVSIFDCGVHAGRDYYAMEYIEGDPLDQYVKGKRLDPKSIVRLFLQAVEAVTHAHQHGVIHRDLKPSNLIVDREGKLHILDFGLAKTLDRDDEAVSAATRVGEFAGTYWYASPEQVRRNPDEVDIRSDVYSLGVILYELLAGRLPYPVERQSIDAVVKHINATTPARLTMFRRDIADDLQTIVFCALEKDPARRYQSAAQLADDLRSFLSGGPIQAKRDNAWYVLRKSLARYRLQVAVAGAAVACLVVFAVVVFVLYTRAAEATATTYAKMEYVRDNQGFSSRKSAEFHRESNRLRELADGGSDASDPLRPLPPAAAVDWPPSWTLLAASAPATFDRFLDPHGLDAGGELVVWLDEHDAELESAARLLQKQAVRFPNQQRGESNLLLSSLPGELAHGRTLGALFCARGLRACRAGDSVAALANLDAARAVGLDMADGPQLHDKSTSIEVRSLVLETARAVLAEAHRGAQPVGGYVAWILRDPPLVEYRFALTDERQRRMQICESVAVGIPGDPEGYLDLAELRRRFAAFLGSSDANQKPMDGPRRVRADPVTKLIDEHIASVEGWDAMTARTLREARVNLRARLHAHPDWMQISRLFPDYGGAFEYRGRAASLREGTRLAACVFAFHDQTGHWPASLPDAVAATPVVARAGIRDPYLGTPYTFRVESGSPLIYTWGEDEVDDGGVHGAWTKAGADVVVFPPPAAP